MKRWLPACLIVALACIPIWLTRSTSDALLADTDTRTLIEAIERRHSPLSWFVGDWPLENHFYRPVSTLTFELDQALHPGSGAGFGATNAVLVMACVFALFWLVRELTDRPLFGAASAAVFAIWNTWTDALAVAIWPLVALGILGLTASLSGGRRPLTSLVALATAAYSSYELTGTLQLRGGSLDWLPGRTATTMTVFALASMAAYARFERLGAMRIPKEATATDEPATKGTTQAGKSTVWPWPIAAVVFGALAFGAYEQAVMLPACLLGVAVSFRWRGFRVRWAWQIAFWGLLLLYFAARKTFIPPGTSEYQLQQYRASVDVFMTVMDYLFPAARQIQTLFGQAELGIASILLTQIGTLGAIACWSIGVAIVAKGAQLGKAATDLWGHTAFTCYLLSAIAFLPMAWLKPFPSYNHYHFWSMSIRAAFAVALVGLSLRLVLSGASLRSIRAPRRLVPAPGSLPRP